MSATAARLLRLLALLEQRRDWTGPQLAERLGVTSRTIRADVERLRDLGYPVHAEPGVGGGYRLGAGTALPPLILDDDEAVAVAVGLRTAAGGTIAGIDDASVRALAKLDQVLPSRLRRRVHALQAYVEPLASGGPAVDADLLVAIASAARDLERLRLTYRTHAGETIRRIVEPHQLVHLGRFWYLVAWDLHRDAWRTFRLDRFAGTPIPDRRFTRRPPPDGGFAAHVARARSAARDRHQAQVIVHAPADAVRERVAPAYGTVEALDDGRSMLHANADWLGTLAVHIALLEADFEVVSPPELATEVERLAERFGRAAQRARTPHDP